MAITAAAEDVRRADAQQLTEELSAELAQLYEVADGSAGFHRPTSQCRTPSSPPASLRPRTTN